MNLLNAHFRNLQFTIVDEKDGYAIYGAGIQSQLAGKKRYVLLFVKSQFATQRQASINELNYDNLQTRELSYSYKLKPQPFVPSQKVEDVLFESIQRTKEKTVYRSHGLPLQIELLHDPKKQTVYQYNNKVTLTAALGMFNTVITVEDYTRDVGNAQHTQHYTQHNSLHYPQSASFELL